MKVTYSLDFLKPNLLFGIKLNALFMIYKSVEHRLSISFEEFSEALKDWETIPLMQNDRLIGGVIVKGNELHVGYAEKPKASIRANIKETLIPLIKKHGFVVTSVAKDNIDGLIFCKRLGFVETSQNSDKILLKCDGSHYV
jgi:hypothetical protein